MKRFALLMTYGGSTTEPRGLRGLRLGRIGQGSWSANREDSIELCYLEKSFYTRWDWGTEVQNVATCIAAAILHLLAGSNEDFETA